MPSFSQTKRLYQIIFLQKLKKITYNHINSPSFIQKLTSTNYLHQTNCGEETVTLNNKEESNNLKQESKSSIHEEDSYKVLNPAINEIEIEEEEQEETTSENLQNTSTNNLPETNNEKEEEIKLPTNTITEEVLSPNSSGIFNMNISATDTLNEIAIEFKPCNTDDSFSETRQEIQDYDNSNNNCFIQYNNTETLTNTDSQTTNQQINIESSTDDFK